MMNQSLVATAVRALPDADLGQLAAHADLRSLPDETLAALAVHLTGEARGRFAAALGEAVLDGKASGTVPGPQPISRGKGRPRSGRAPGEKRSQDQITTIGVRIMEHFQTQPKGTGLRMEAIKAALGLPTRELTLPIKKLLAEKRLTSKGQKRATEYFVAKGAR